MSQNNDSHKVTFQITIVRLTCSRLRKEDIRVTIRIGHLSKITCSGKFSNDCLTIRWNHPFLFTASPSTPVLIALWVLPGELTPNWDKKALGDQIVTNVASLLESSHGWKCNVLKLHNGPATLSMTCRACDELIAPHSHDCLLPLWRYWDELADMSMRFRNVAALSTQIDIGQAMVDLCPDDQADYPQILGNLALAILSRYDIQGNISDLNRAIEISQQTLDLSPSSYPWHAEALGWLAASLWRCYHIYRNEADINKAIELTEKRLHLCSFGHPSHANALGTLAIYLQNRFHINGDMTDLDRAIDMTQKVLDIGVADHQAYVPLGNLALSLHTRYIKRGNLTDLEKAIELQERHLALCPASHPKHPDSALQLAQAFTDHYKETKTHSDLVRATKLYQASLDGYPIQHKYFSMTVLGLAEIILLPFKSSDKPFLSSEEAFETYRLLKACGPAASVDLWNATQAWIKDAEEHNHPSVLEAYQTSLNTLDHLTSMQSSVDSRHETIQARVADLANDAFSCAVRHGNLEMAVELLEQGRGILWNQLARFDTSLAVLKSLGNQGRELGNRFARLSASLKNHAEGIGTVEGMEPYWRVHEEWKLVIDEIRRQEGFSRFLLPPHFDDLQKATECGPVIVVNASMLTCDALIILHTQPPVHVPLRCSLDDVNELCSQFSELIQYPHAYEGNRESWVKQSLRELWSSVVEPIVTVLQNDVQLPTGSRIWWYPTSVFNILPFHAAGPHRKFAKNLMDTYVSSYAPSLSALIRTRERVRSQKKACNPSKSANVISFAAVGQAHPSVDLKLHALPEVEFEIQRIQHETTISPDVSFDIVTGVAATIEGAVQAFRDHRWVHLACHGAQHATKPFESWFAMGDGQLTLTRIIQERYTHSEFAFLSACHTAVGDRSTPDEVIHLAAGIQFAGFNGVIGTLWRVDDSVAHQVVTRFYREMFKRSDIGFEHAATALNVAVVETANEVPLENRIVFVHIGI